MTPTEIYTIRVELEREAARKARWQPYINFFRCLFLLEIKRTTEQRKQEEFNAAWIRRLTYGW